MELSEITQESNVDMEREFPQLLTSVRAGHEARKARTFFQSSFPYVQHINNQEYSVLFKLDPTQFGPQLASFDLGNYEGSRFISQAAFDFRILTQRKNGQKISEYGYADQRQEVTQGAFVQRPKEQAKEALFVAQDLRGYGFGKALITMARVALHESGVDTLVLGEALTLNPQEPLGKFYAQTKGYLFHITPAEQPQNYTDATDAYKGNRIAYPTRSSARFPYQLK